MSRSPTDLPMFAARVARLRDQQRAEKAGWAAPVRVAESPRLTLLANYHTSPRSRQRRTSHSRPLQRENASELLIPLAVRMRERFERSYEGFALRCVHRRVTRLFTICQRRSGRLRGRPPANGPRLRVLSHADGLVVRDYGLAGTSDFGGLRETTSTGCSRPETAQHGVTSASVTFPCGEWDRCSGDES